MLGTKLPCAFAAMNSMPSGLSCAVAIPVFVLPLAEVKLEARLFVKRDIVSRHMHHGPLEW